MHRLLVLSFLLALSVTSARAEDRPVSKAQVARYALPRSVRVQLVVAGEARRNGSGVAVADASESGRPRTLLITNAHVADPKGLSDVQYRVLLERHGRIERTLQARLVRLGQVPELDLALLEVDAKLPVAELGSESQIEIGDELLVVGAPYGRALSVSSGLVSQIDAEESPGEARFKGMKTDAAIGYGSSGGGVFSVPGARLVGIVEGYRTARVNIDDRTSFDVPMPGETFVAPITKLRQFITGAASKPTAEAAR
jgi:serine protease Do